MMMSTSIQRAEQASAAFKRTLQCEGVPEKDRANATAAIGHAETRLAQLREGLAMPDMDPSNCSQQSIFPLLAGSARHCPRPPAR